MAEKKITDKHKLACYLLYEEFKRPQQKIANLFEVSQPTVSAAIKEARYMIALKETQKQLEEVRQELRERLPLETNAARLLPDSKNIIDI